MIRQILYPSKFGPINAPTNPTTTIQWFGPLSEPRKLAVAAAVLVASGCTIPARPPAAAPNGWRAQLSVPAQAPRKHFQAFGNAVPLQPPAPVVVPQGWYRALSEPYFQTQTALTRVARVTSPIFSFRPPAPPPPAPILAFYQQLSYPVFAQVKYPSARVHFLPWNLLPPPIVIPPLWQPQNPAVSGWSDATGASGSWSSQLSGSTTWTDV